LLERREHLVEPGGRRAAGSVRLLESGDQIVFAVALDALDRRGYDFDDLLGRRVLEVGVDRPDEHLAQVQAKSAFPPP